LSKLKKAIERAGKRDSTPLGFTRVEQEKRRAMLLCVQANSDGDASKARDAGVDVVMVATDDAGKAGAAIKAANGVVAGTVVADLSNDSAAKLAEAGVDFIASPFDKTAATAVDTGRTGHVIAIDGEHDDATLRALAPLGLDALLVDRGAEALTLQQQAKFVRVAQLTSTPLLFKVAPSIEVDELRVLRDSGGAGVVLPAGTSASDIEAVNKRLREVPDPRRGDRSADVAVLPALLGRSHEHDDDGDEPDDE
jgi:hypothetical protein